MTLTTHRRQIPASGETIPVIGLGTWRSFDVGRGAAVRAPLEQCLAAFDSLGGGMIDSSPMYGNAEQVLGDLVTSLGIRNRVFLATKVWTSGRQRGIEQMRDSMRKLGATQIDLMQVHNLVDVDTHLDTLRQWKAEGLVRYVGITHYTAHAHRDVARIIEREPLDFVQINYSVAEREAEQSILPLAAERQVAVIVNRPFGTGAALGPLRGKPLPPWAGELDCATWAQLLLKFVVSHPAVTCAIPATANVEHLRENMRAGTGPMPDEAQRGAIVKAAHATR